MKKPYLIAAAESYARVNNIDSACYHYLKDGYSLNLQQHLTAHYSHICKDKVPLKYIDAVITTALIELSYPVADNKAYAWSDRQRCAFAGISRTTWKKHKLSETVNFIIDDIRSKHCATRAKIIYQLHSNQIDA